MVLDFTQFWLDGWPGNEYFWISHNISGHLTPMTPLGVHPQWFESTWNKYKRFLLLWNTNGVPLRKKKCQTLILQFSTVFKNLTFFSESFTGCDGSGNSITEIYACCNSTNKPQGCGLFEGDCDRCRPCPFNQISSQFYHDFVKMLLAKVSFHIGWNLD